MEAGAIAFVPGKAVARVLIIRLAHDGIPCGLGQNGCAGNADGELIAFDKGGLGQV